MVSDILNSPLAMQTRNALDAVAWMDTAARMLDMAERGMTAGMMRAHADELRARIAATYSSQRTDAAATKPGGGTPPATLPLVSLGQGDYRRDILAEDVVDPRGAEGRVA